MKRKPSAAAPEVGEEAEFFGSMDGASKFVRGDAIAGIIILFINIIGGLIIGVAQHGLSAGEAADSYILLAVGDALVAQIPSLLISVAAAMVVSRVGKDADLGGQIVTQMFSSPKVLGITATMLFMLGVVPGMPHVVFLTFASIFGGLAWWRLQEERQPVPVEAQAPVNPDGEATWDDLQPVDLLGLELGYRLIAMVDKDRQGDLLTRIKGVRKKFAQEVGFLPPAVHVRDNLELKPSGYRITLRGVVVGEGEVFPGMFLAIDPGGVNMPLIGTPTTDPAFGLPAHWIEEKQRENAQMAGFTVVDSETVLATHLSHLMQVQAAKLLSRTETQELVEHVTRLAPKLIEEVVPKMISVAVFQKVLQLLLEESVHVRDIRTIIEAIAEHAAVHHRPGGAGPPRAHGAGAGHRAADLWPGQRAGSHRHRARPGAPADAVAVAQRHRCARPRCGRNVEQVGHRHRQPARGKRRARLPAGARRHPQRHGAPAAPRGAAPAGAGAQ